jgi:hypothetical protein
MKKDKVVKPKTPRKKAVKEIIPEIKKSDIPAQEIFNTVLFHLRAQNKKSFTNPKIAGECAYRSADGLRCGIGILIQDNEYSPELEHYTVGQMLALPFTPISLKERLHSHLANWFLKDLQDIHDVFPIAEWEAKLEALAKKHQLNWTPK